ncbi:hypothetical protein [Stenomitos frigidus]|uniref:Uncharacterized protein n=1 Tax=Stenomitos frigidus ULC18 TaxID=2107698 RepID=A0A2T1E0H4_9CYAN|nr:hypothetical protein [Stenomitos frigidus]PSB26219.1 hypothetical protein C7B82_20590 [Stenomitos frigidus ULC18]
MAPCTAASGDRQLRTDGTFDPKLPNRPSPNYEWNGSAWSLPAKAANWQGLTETFSFPGNGLYTSVYNSVKAANTSDVLDHWGNFKLMLATPSLQTIPALAAGLSYLVYLLAQAGQTIPAEAKQEWNSLVINTNFPDSCKLS